jgi:hypothetical protein
MKILIQKQGLDATGKKSWSPQKKNDVTVVDIKQNKIMTGSSTSYSSDKSYPGRRQRAARPDFEERR